METDFEEEELTDERQNNMELDYFLLESNYEFQLDGRTTWSLIEISFRLAIMRNMSRWFKKDEFDPEAGFILSYCSGDIQYHVDQIVREFMEAWVK